MCSSAQCLFIYHAILICKRCIADLGFSGDKKQQKSSGQPLFLCLDPVFEFLVAGTRVRKYRSGRCDV
jgi:hypothetical protein